MQNALSDKKNSPAWPALLALYAAFCALRIALAFLYAPTPSILPDESLYFNLARSLFTGGGVAYRGQPINYDSILYPLFLSPLLALPQSVNIQRAIQVANALAMNLAVFPAWGLTHRLTGSRQAAWFVAVFTLLMPDMALTRFAMTENIGHPLVMLALYCAFRTMQSQKTGDALWVCALSFLLYMTKPGLIAVMAAFLLTLLVLWLRHKSPATLRQLVCACLGFLALYGLWQLLARLVLRIDYGFHSLYQTQTHPLSAQHLLQTLEGLLLYLFYFPVACLVLPLLVPASHVRRLSARERPVLDMLWAIVLMTIVATSYIIFSDEHTGTLFFSRVHLRYLAIFVPPLLALSLSPSLEGARLNRPMAAGLLLLLAGAFGFSFASLMNDPSRPIDALMLTITQWEIGSLSLRGVAKWALITGLLLGALALWRVGWTKAVRRTVLGLLLALSLANNSTAYLGQARTIGNAALARDAREAAALLPGGEALGAASDGQAVSVFTATLDVHCRTPLMYAELDDIVTHAGRGGTYQPFTPHGYWMEHALHATPDAKWIVLDEMSLFSLRLLDTAQTIRTGGGLYTLVYVENETPWLHSALTGAKNSVVQENCRISVFDEALCAAPAIRITLTAHGSEGDTLTLSCGEFMHTEAMTGQAVALTLDVPAATGGDPLHIELDAGGGGDVLVYYFTVSAATEG